MGENKQPLAQRDENTDPITKVQQAQAYVLA